MPWRFLRIDLKELMSRGVMRSDCARKSPYVLTIGGERKPKQAARF